MFKRFHIEKAPIAAEKLNRRNSLLLLAVACACVGLVSPTALAQASAASSPASSIALPAPAFDVATIKPIPPGGRPTHGIVGGINHPDGIEFSYETLPELLCYAYGYKGLRFDGQITGVPEWAATQRYDIQAKIGAADMAEFQKLGKDQQEQRRQAMMQSLLAERFHLTLHRGSKSIPVYEMVVAKGGIKMKDAATDPTPPQLSKDADGKPIPDIRFLRDTSIVQAYSMNFLADLLSIPAAAVGRPVLDKTGLTGTYNFTFDWSIYSAVAAAKSGTADSDSANDVPTIFTALGKIGLRLQPAMGPIETIVVDHVEKPTEN